MCSAARAKRAVVIFNSSPRPLTGPGHLRCINSHRRFLGNAATDCAPRNGAGPANVDGARPGSQRATKNPPSADTSLRADSFERVQELMRIKLRLCAAIKQIEMAGVARGLSTPREDGTTGALAAGWIPLRSSSGFNRIHPLRSRYWIIREFVLIFKCLN